MRLGALVRCDNRGLGVLTGEFWRHLKPDRVLVVMMGPAGLTPYKEHPERYPDGLPVAFERGQLRDSAIDWLLDGCDLVYSAETFYDNRIIERARQRDVRTVCQGMFEFLKWLQEPLPRPDLFLAPSTWHLEQWPDPTEYLPFPVARDRLPPFSRERARTFLHVAGHPAMADRNGTRALWAALPLIHGDIEVVIRTQAAIGRPRNVRRVKVRVEHADVENYWDLYDGADVLIAPRRYGGLSLPMQEATSLAMPVISTDMAPQNEWLPRGGLVPVSRTRPLRVPSGTVVRAEVQPRALANKIDQLAEDDELVALLSAEADAVAATLSWEALQPRYEALFADVVARAPAG